MAQTESDNPRFRLGFRDTLRILWPYVKRNFMNQIQGIWFIVAYLVIFQLFVLQLPIVYASMIAVGILIVAIGLMFFMEGLRLGLMPLGEEIGSVLPKKSRMPVILLFAFLLGAGATFAEPAIAVLKAAGSGVHPEVAPLLYSLLNDFSGELVSAVAVGVGCAVMLGVLRFFYAWPLKYLAIPAVILLLSLSFYFSQIPVLSAVLGLAWDCGAVTTGPVTVPLVLALGMGVCRVVSSGSSGSSHSGFGIVTLASLFPILAVLLLALFHYVSADYWGAENYAKDINPTQQQVTAQPAELVLEKTLEPVSDREFDEYLQSGKLPRGYELEFHGGVAELQNGKITVTNPDITIKKLYQRDFSLISDQTWDETRSFKDQFVQASMEALRAIIPLCLFLYVVLRMVLHQKLAHQNDVGIGVTFALVGMAVFSLGIALGLTPLGGQLGSNVPISFAEIVPWGLDHVEGPLLDGHLGKFLAVGFAFFLGYGATLAEPALHALGDTVERITVGAFRKKLLMQSVAIGVGFGIAAGIFKMAYNLPLIWMLIPSYSLVLVLTWFAPHSFVNFSWDSAGVTTGPITVPL
ncbi:MAG: DUF1538 domain-containing protein, partial [Gammaproteobacteria bacterium]|nr:DUF1538 domain-containing protein [Gammaproteobacteria bacterium]